MESDLYRTIAPVYDPILTPVLRSLRRDIATYIRFRKYRRVVDVCCGTGDQLRYLTGPGMELCGIDNSLAMLEQAHRKSPSEIAYHHLDIDQTMLQRSDFDCAILSFSLHEKHPATGQSVYDHTCAMVRPGGSVILADFSRSPSSPVGRLFGRLVIPLVERLAGSDHYHNYSNWMARGALEGFLQRQRTPSDIICRPIHRCVLCCSVDIPGQGLGKLNSMSLLNQSLNTITKQS